MKLPRFLLLFFLLLASLIATATFVQADAANEIEPNNTLETAQAFSPIGSDNPINSRIDPLDDVDWYSFSAVSGQSYVIETFNVAGSINSRGYALQLEVYDSNLTQIASDTGTASNGAGNTNSSVSINAGLSGTFYIKVSSYSSYRGVGPYSLRVLPRFDQPEASWDANQEPNNWSQHAFGLVVGSNNAITTNIEARSSSYMTNAHDRDWFRFEATAGDKYVVETFNVAGAINSRDRALQMVIYDSDFTNVAEDTGSASNGRGNANASLQFEATKGGTYFIQIYPEYYYGGSGSYSLRVLPSYDKPGASWDENHEPNNWSAHAHSLQLGQENALTTNIEKRNGSYLTDNSDRDWFRIQAEAGKTYAIETFNVAGSVNSQARAMQLYVYDSNFTEVAIDTGSSSNGAGNTNGTVQFVATTGGVYFIQVLPEYYYAGSGTYSIRFLPKHDQPEASWDANHEPNNASAHSFKLQVGRTNALTTNFEARNSSYITDAADRDWYNFEGVAGQNYVVEVFNAAGAINSRNYPVQIAIYDSDSTKVGEDTGSGSNGGGNVSGSVAFEATKGGTYYVVAYPYGSYAASGPYSIRILPKHDKAQANWDSAFEPNNSQAHAFPMALNSCRLTSIEARDASYLTHNADRDWFVFNVIKDKEYVIDVYDISSRFSYYGLNASLYDRENSELFTVQGDDEKEIIETFTANYTGVYYLYVAPRTNTDGVYRLRIGATDGQPCDDRALPQVTVEGCGSFGVNPETGEVIISGPRGRNCSQTFSRVITCDNGSTPQNVSLNIGSSSLPMSHAGSGRFSVSVNLNTNLPTGNGPFKLSISKVCGAQSEETDVGSIQLFDPSGVITDAETGAKIVGATVTLARIPGAVPDKAGQTNDCRTVDTRGGNDWSKVAAANVNDGEVVDAVLDGVVNNQQIIAPVVNPQITGTDGGYAWDVVEGCWFVVVEAPGYATKVSALVGVPPAVTDLHIALERSSENIFLPLITR